MWRILLILAAGIVLGSGAAQAANQKLYLKDGNYHVVREYKVDADRVRYYSTEREEWEEIPLDLVDLTKTEKEFKSRQEEIAAEAKEIDEEDQMRKEIRRQIASIPVEHGAYYERNGKMESIKQAEVKAVTDKKRSVLKVMSPIPIVSGKSTIEIDGLQSSFTVPGPRPEFFVRVSDIEEPIAIVKLGATKANRIVEVVNIIPVTKELAEDRKAVDTFKQQMAEGLFKIWPSKPMEPGEYAVIEYTEGKGNPQVWDFTVK